jgi:type IV pilus assembly protein PilF
MRPESRRLPWLLAAALVTAGCGGAPPRSASPSAGGAASPAEIQVGLAQGYLRQGRLDIAMARANRALELDPRLPSAHTVAAIIYQRVGDEEAAARHYARAVELAPRDGDVLNNHGTFLCARGEFERADALFERALRDPFYRTPAVALANRGSCALKAGRVDEADRYLRAALEIEPAYGDALFAMASLNHARGDDLRARAFIERYLAAAPASAEALALAIRIEERLGNRRQAEDYRSRLRREFPDSDAALRDSGVQS